MKIACDKDGYEKSEKRTILLNRRDTLKQDRVTGKDVRRRRCRRMIRDELI